MNSTTNDPLSPVFWEQYLNRYSKGCKNDPSYQAKIWDKAATDYDSLETSGSYQTQIETILEYLMDKDVLNPDHNILDVACGTGTYAIRMSPFVKEIDCLDISRNMLKRLKQKAQVLGTTNINTICMDWHNFHPERKYDLVFASMTPILRSTRSLDRLLSMSTKFLAIVFWAGVRKNLLLAYLYKKILNEPYNKKSMDIISIFNYYCSLGFRPDLMFFHGEWIRKKSLDEAYENLLWRLELRRPLSEKEKELLVSTIRQKADGNTINLETKVRIGFMLLSKDTDTC